MPEHLPEYEREFLLTCVDEAIGTQAARLELERRELARLRDLRAKIDEGFLPDGKIEKVRSGMVSLDLLNLTRGRK